jgi:divalent metal cation (Fe/Co/Zn/Cd) transporter
MSEQHDNLPSIPPVPRNTGNPLPFPNAWSHLLGILGILALLLGVLVLLSGEWVIAGALIGGAFNLFILGHVVKVLYNMHLYIRGIYEK